MRGSGSDTFQLGGTGDGSFDLSTFGAEYSGFTTFNVVSGTWTVTGSFTPVAPWTVEGGTLIENGTLSDGVIVDNGGTLVLSASSNVGGSITLNAGSTLEFDTSVSYAGPISINGAADVVVAAGQTATLTSIISDGAMQAGELLKTGAGTLTLTGAETYFGGTAIDAGTLELGANASLASGTITFGAASVTLRLDAPVVGTAAFGNTLADISSGDQIDLAGLQFEAGTTGATVSGSQLTVTDGTTTETFTLASPATTNFQTSADGNGGVLVTDEAFAAPAVAGTRGGQMTTSEMPVMPFTGVTVTDGNSGATDTLTISLSGPGTLSGTGLTGSGDVYHLSGTAAAITSELDALTFTPVNGVPGTSVTTTFTLSDLSNEFVAPVVNNTTTVTDTDPAPSPSAAINFPHVANSNVDEWILSNGQWAASAEPGSIPSGYQVAGVGDFTSSGTSDILWQNPTTGDTQEWLIKNGGWNGTVELGGHPGNYQIAGVGDFFGNGIDDVLWTSTSANGTVATDIWELGSNGQWEASVSPGSHPAGYNVVGVGDFTGNGTSDILWQNPTSGDVDEWQIADGQWSKSVDLGSHPGSGWTIAGVGDFFGNGTDDILWTNSTGGQVQTDIWQLGPNGQWQDSVSPGSHPAGYSLVGVGNFTGNGTSDILWQDAATGDVDEWLINNGKWAGSIDLGGHPGNFQVAGAGALVNGNATSDILWQSHT